MTALSTAAWIAHDLGIATGVGGSIFGQLAMHPATRNIPDEQQRGVVISDAWRSFNMVELGALGVMAVSWFVGRTALSGGEVDATSRRLTILKDVLVIGTLVSAAGAAISGRKMQAASNGAPPISSNGQTLTPDAPDAAKAANAATGVFSVAKMICGAGVIGVTAVLAMRAGKSARWSMISRLLP